MPIMSWFIQPEFYLEHRGFKVYSTYKNNDCAQGKRKYHFTLDPRSDNEDCVFDVTTILPGSISPLFLHMPKHLSLNETEMLTQASLHCRQNDKPLEGGIYGLVSVLKEMDTSDAKLVAEKLEALKKWYSDDEEGRIRETIIKAIDEGLLETYLPE